MVRVIKPGKCFLEVIKRRASPYFELTQNYKLINASRTRLEWVSMGGIVSFRSLFSHDRDELKTISEPIKG